MKKSFSSVNVNAFFLVTVLVLVLANYVQAETMYGTSGGSGGGYANPGNFMIVDQTSGAVTLLGTPYAGCGMPGLAINSSGRAYAVTSIHDDIQCPINPDSTSHLIEINPATGALIADIGPLHDASGNGCAVGDLSFQPGTGVLFGLAGNQGPFPRCGIGSGTGGYLLTINTTNASYTIIGRDASLGNDNGGIAFAPNGTLYFTPVWTHPGLLLTLDPTNAHILTTVALPSGCGYMGLGVRPSDGTIFASYQSNNGLITNTGIYTINPTTGAETLVGNPGNIMVADLDFLGTATAVPTMSEWGMIIFALLAAVTSVYYLRRRKTQRP